MAGGLHGGEIVLVEEVGRLPLVAEDRPVRPRRAHRAALVQEGAERRPPSANSTCSVAFSDPLRLSLRRDRTMPSLGGSRDGPQSGCRTTEAVGGGAEGGNQLQVLPPGNSTHDSRRGRAGPGRSRFR